MNQSIDAPAKKKRWLTDWEHGGDKAVTATWIGATFIGHLKGFGKRPQEQPPWGGMPAALAVILIALLLMLTAFAGIAALSL